MTADNQRCVLNLGFLSVFNYAFINHILNGDGCISPVGSSFNGTVNSAAPWPTYIDASGWPNTAIPASNYFGGGFRIPDPANFAGPYVLTWEGDTEILLGGTGITWTETNANTTWTRVSNGRWKNKSGQTMRVEFTVSSTQSGPQLVAFTLLSTNTNGGGYVKNLKLYRLEDEEDLQSGKVFRMPFKQSISDLNPGSVRFMDWHGGNNCKNIRFENRTLPSAAGYSGGNNFVASPVYASNATFTDGAGTANQYTLAAATPTSANTKNTPASMVHGELATCRVGPAMVRGTTGNTVTGITKANPGVVSCTGHGFSTGDMIIHVMSQTGSNFVGMTQLNYRPVTITVIDANSYSIGVDTTGFTTFANGTGNGTTIVQAYQFPTLQVGTGNDRVAYPIVQPHVSVPATSILTNTHYTFYFDKTVAAQRDASGNWVYGVWIQSTSQAGGHVGDVPLEIITSLINELNQISPSPINLWLNNPHMGMSSMDPDYSSGSNWPVNALNVVMNGANGYGGLTERASVIEEDSNEKWNFGGTGFLQTPYLCWKGYNRWGASAGTTDNVGMAILRSTVMARDIRGAYPGDSQIKIVLGLQGAVGIASGSGNYLRVYGSTNYLNDASVTGGSFGTPISNHDGTCHATYFDAGNVYYSGSGTGSFTDDSAMYAGTTPYSTPDQAQAIANFVNQVIVAATGSNAQPLNQYVDPGNPTAGLDYAYGQAMSALGKLAYQYEGGPDFRTKLSDVTWGRHTVTTADSIFLTACLDSNALGKAMSTYMTARATLTGVVFPSVYTYIGQGTDRRWSYCGPDTYADGVEGKGLLKNGPWAALSLRNKSKRRFVLKT